MQNYRWQNHYLSIAGMLCLLMLTLLGACGETTSTQPVVVTTAPVVTTAATTVSNATTVVATTAPIVTTAGAITTAAVSTAAPVATTSTPTSVATVTIAATTAPATTAATTTAAVTTAVATTVDTTPKVVAAAEAFLATLDATQRTKVSFDFNDSAQRAKWSNFPTGIFARAGLSMGSLTEPQRTAAMAVVATTLSKQGYQKLIDAMNADEALKNSSGGGNLMFGKDLYYISFLGTPSVTTPWMWQFGGHHFALNATIVGTEIVMTPSLTGAQPATFTLNGQTVRPVGDENDKAFKLIAALDATQLQKMTIGSNVKDLVLGPGQDGKVLQPEGLKASELNADQQALLLDVISEWTNIVNDEDAAVKMNEVKANLAVTYFAWSGPTTPGGAAYYRITAPTLLIEYSPQQLGGAAVNHLHIMYRDPTNDYGAKLVKP